MTAYSDRILGPFRAVIRAATARTDYYALYGAVVNTDNGDETCDLTPEDARLPSMSKIPKLYGVPGTTSTLTAGAKVLICFQNGDPSKPAIVLFGSGTPTKVAFAPSTELDLVGSSDAVALASQVVSQLNVIKSAISAAVVAPGDGGASFKAALIASLASFPGSSIPSTKVKAS